MFKKPKQNKNASKKKKQEYALIIFLSRQGPFG